MLDAEVTGVLPRMGVTHETGIPGNPQGRGIIERFMKDVPKLIAQSFASYYGKNGDSGTVRQRQKAIISHNRAIIKGKSENEMTELQAQGGKLLPTWQELYDTVARAIDWYNNEHTHSSIGMTPAQKRAELYERHQTTPVYPSEFELLEMYKVGYKRKVVQCVIEHLTGKFFCHELINYHQQEVMVYVDQHDLSYLVVRDFDGKYLGTAKLNANQVDTFPKDMVEYARQKSDEARIKNRKTYISQIEHEANKQAVIDVQHEMATSFDYATLGLQNENEGELVLYETFDLDEPFKKAI